MLLEIIIEFFVQLIGEFIVEVSVQNLKRDKPIIHPILALPVYALIGASIGYISVAIFPHHLISHPLTKWINLAITPILVGLDKFGYGYVFALAFALARHFLGNI